MNIYNILFRPALCIFSWGFILVWQVFLASPSVITFTDYQVGQVYETTLDLKNISSSLRPVRVLPTSTNFFSVGLGKSVMNVLSCDSMSKTWFLLNVSVLASNRSSLLVRTLLRFARFHRHPSLDLLRGLLYLEVCKSRSASSIELGITTFQ